MKIESGTVGCYAWIGTPKGSQLMNGKWEPDVAFIKAIYQKLKIAPKFILERV